MGTWDAGPFDNDDAADWTFAFEHADVITGLTLIETTLRTVAQWPADDYLESHDGANVVAAAAVLAHLIDGEPPSDSEKTYGSDAFAWVTRTSPVPPSELLELAVRALARVTSPSSELASLWAEAGPRWRSSVDELSARLRPEGSAAPWQVRAGDQPDTRPSR